MATSVNKGYELQVTGTNIDTWGNVLNASVFAIVDRNLGGAVTKSLSNATVNLDATESQNMRLTLIGVLSANVLVTTLSTGFTVVENLTTGAFNVSFQKNGVGSPIVLPQGSRTMVMTGATGDPASVGVDFPSGTRMLFQQTTPPPGWTKDSTAFFNDCGLRLVTGSVVNGGSTAFTSVFQSRTPAGTVGPTALSVAQLPSHQHGYLVPTLAGSPTGSGATRIETTTPGLTDATGSGETHTHGLTMNAMDFAVKYADFVIGVKA